MDRLWTIQTMALTWGLPQAMISQITKNMTPVDYEGYGRRRRGLYSAREVAEELARDAEGKLRRAEKSVTVFKDRLRRLAPILQDED